MAFIYCAFCDWQQDDFWHEKYSPFHGGHFNLPDIVRDAVLKGKRMVGGFDEDFRQDHPKWPMVKGEDGWYIDFREYVALQLETTAKIVRNMKWPTHKDFVDDPDKKCPQCGKSMWSID